MSQSEFHHISVLLNECIEALHIRDGFQYVDCTTGGGGHSLEIAKHMGPNSHLFCIDRDEDALRAAKDRLKDYSKQITFIHRNFEELEDIIKEYSIDNLGGVLADLGCSSFQFDTPERGFSYMHDAPLDMRMDMENGDLTAYQVVNSYSEADLCDILYTYGEEKFASRIVKNIIKQRAVKPIETTFELVSIIKSSIPASQRQDGPHPAKRTFQAIRIEVNHELDSIKPVIEAAAKGLMPTGRIAVITFHSLEDRLAKTTFQILATGCTCPRDFPVCVCGKKPIIEILTKKPILPSTDELEQNPRSRSAKLRIAEKL